MTIYKQQTIGIIGSTVPVSNLHVLYKGQGFFVIADRYMPQYLRFTLLLLLSLLPFSGQASTICSDSFDLRGLRRSLEKKESQKALPLALANLQKGDVVVDSELGIVIVDSIEAGSLSVLQGKSAYFLLREKHSMEFSTRKLTDLHKRTMAKIQTKEALEIIRQRITDHYGLPLIRMYFQLYRLMEIVGNPSKTDPRLLSEIETTIQMYSGINKPATHILAIWSQSVFEGHAPKGLKDTILTAEKLSGEDLTQSGILSSLEVRRYAGLDQWAWPTTEFIKSSEASHIVKSPLTHKAQDVSESVPMDVDHLARSILWKLSERHRLENESRKLTSFESMKRVTRDGTRIMFSEDSAIHLKANGLQVFLSSKEATLKEDVENPWNLHWLHLLEVSGAPFELPSQPISSKFYLVVSKEFDLPTRVEAEIKRQLINQGARGVETIVVD